MTGPILYAVSSWRGMDLPAFRAKRGEVETWCVYDEGDTRGLSDDEVFNVRPLVVLDMDEVDRKAFPEWLMLHRDSDGLASDMAKQIREQVEAQDKARPPKPPEPVGLGAVVKDREGKAWVGIGGGFFAQEHPGAAEWKYGAIDAVEVLAPGVSP